MIDDDVAAELVRLRRLRGGGFKTLIQKALRHGLSEMAATQQRRRRPGPQGKAGRMEKRSAFRQL